MSLPMFRRQSGASAPLFFSQFLCITEADAYKVCPASLFYSRLNSRPIISRARREGPVCFCASSFQCSCSPIFSNYWLKGPLISCACVLGRGLMQWASSEELCEPACCCYFLSGLECVLKFFRLLFIGSSLTSLKLLFCYLFTLSFRSVQRRLVPCDRKLS